MKNYTLVTFLAVVLIAASCKKEGCTDSSASNYNENAKKDDGSCTYSTSTYTVPTTYQFMRNGSSTVDYGGQTDRLNQLREMMVYIKSGKDAVLNATILNDMFSNINGNGNGNFSFTSTRQLKDKCFALDVPLFEHFFDSVAVSSQQFANTASNGQAGTLTTGASEYLFNRNGFEYAQLIEKGLMGAVFQYQALNIYFGDGKMNVDNTTPVAGQTYTQMEHHWDEAFGYFGVATDFPTTLPSDFWGKYAVNQNASLNCNAILMNNFLKGRAAITNNVLADRDAAILAIRQMWEKVAAYQAMTYLDQAVTNFGVDQAKFLHVLSEAYAFIYTIRFAPIETRKMNTSEVDALLNQFGTNLWSITLNDIQSIKTTLDNTY